MRILGCLLTSGLVTIAIPGVVLGQKAWFVQGSVIAASGRPVAEGDVVNGPAITTRADALVILEYRWSKSPCVRRDIFGGDGQHKLNPAGPPKDCTGPTPADFEQANPTASFETSLVFWDPGKADGNNSLDQKKYLDRLDALRARGKKKAAASVSRSGESKVRASALRGVDLTGTWQSNDGGRYYVRQVGTQVWWYGESADGGASWANLFHGTIDSNSLIGDWVDIPKGTTRNFGRLTLDVSATQIHRRAMSGGFGGTEWTRVP